MGLHFTILSIAAGPAIKLHRRWGETGQRMLRRLSLLGGGMLRSLGSILDIKLGIVLFLAALVYFFKFLIVAKQTPRNCA